MKSLVKIIALLLALNATLSYAAGQYLDEDPAPAQVSAVIATESMVNTNTTLELSPNSQLTPAVNAAEIGKTVNGLIPGAQPIAPKIDPLEQEHLSENFIPALLKGLGIAVLLIIISTLPAFFGKGVFFWDITDVLISSILSILVVASFVALVVSYFDHSVTNEARNQLKLIVFLSVIAAYVINFIKATLHNSAVLALLIAFGRLFLPLLIFGAIVLARWHGVGRVSYQRADHESEAEYSARIRRQEQELSENQAKSALWVTLIGITSVWLYRKLIYQKEWCGFTRYFYFNRPN